jgi:tRNA(Ile)-lysidine synthase TilS/MesJ
MSKKRYSAQPSPADEVANYLRRRGISLDPERLELDARLERSREKREFAEYRDQVEAAAFALKRARRACELEEAAWRLSPNPGQPSARPVCPGGA